jgi:hypothetical protein
MSDRKLDHDDRVAPSRSRELFFEICFHDICFPVNISFLLTIRHVPAQAFQLQRNLPDRLSTACLIVRAGHQTSRDGRYLDLSA